MGMFDRFNFLGDMANLVRCPEGHPQTGELQTKDLECEMVEYQVFANNVYTGGRQTSSEPSASYGRLHITSTDTYDLANITANVAVYTSCTKCQPVYHESTTTWGGSLGSDQPWCEWEICIDRGAIIGIVPLLCETRDDVKRKVAARGQTPLPDDDRVVKRELEKWKAEIR